MAAKNLLFQFGGQDYAIRLRLKDISEIEMLRGGKPIRTLDGINDNLIALLVALRHQVKGLTITQLMEQIDKDIQQERTCWSDVADLVTNAVMDALGRPPKEMEDKEQSPLDSGDGMVTG